MSVSKDLYKKKVAIVQSNYIPWKGYFDMINMVDEFIIYDDAQYTKRDWRNRNKIKTKNGLKWLTIPVKVKGRYLQAVKDVIIEDQNWIYNHLATIKHNYSKSRYFKELFPSLENLYLCHARNKLYLSEVNLIFIKFFCKILKIKTKITSSVNYNISKKDQNQKLIELCLHSKAKIYLSGPKAKGYIDESQFKKESIKIEWYDYNGYLKYKQLYDPFFHNVSVIDLWLNNGSNAYSFLKSNKLP